jgi:hypothetical protein
MNVKEFWCVFLGGFLRPPQKLHLHRHFIGTRPWLNFTRIMHVFGFHGSVGDLLNGMCGKCQHWIFLCQVTLIRHCLVREFFWILLL